MATAQQAEQTADNNQSMRADMERAIEAIENNDDEAITTETEADAELTAGDLFNDEEGEEAEAQAKVEAEAEEILGKESSTEERAAEGASESRSDDDEQSVGDTPPVGWTPAAREEWAKLPEVIKKQVAKREHEIDLRLTETAEDRKTGEKFKAITDQYAQVIAAEGATDAITGVSELMKTVSTLRMGSPQQKAHRIAQFIDHYGIDVNMLDDILSKNIGGGQPAPVAGANADMEAIIEQRMAPVNKLLAQMDENTKRQNFDSNQKMIAEVQTFKAANEFYTDVQDDMADLVEMAQKREYVMPLKEAYDKACAMNPEVNKILIKRASDAALMNGKEEIASKKEAASSIMGRQGAPAGEGELDMRQTMEKAWDAQTG